MASFIILKDDKGEIHARKILTGEQKATKELKGDRYTFTSYDDEITLNRKQFTIVRVY